MHKKLAKQEVCKIKSKKTKNFSCFFFAFVLYYMSLSLTNKHLGYIASLCLYGSIASYKTLGMTKGG